MTRLAVSTSLTAAMFRNGRQMKVAPVVASVALIGMADHAAAFTVGADADAYVRGGSSAATNFDFVTDPTNGVFLLVKDELFGLPNSDFTFGSYIRFDVSSFGGTAASAQVEITINEISTSGFSPSSVGYELFLLEDGLDGWGEQTITFNNQPSSVGNTSQPNVDPINATFIDRQTVSDMGPDAVSVGDTVVFSSQALVDAINTGGGIDGLLTFVLVDGTGLTNGAAFASREDARFAGPQLVVSEAAAVVPLPAAGGLLVAALLGLGVVSRRRR